MNKISQKVSGFHEIMDEVANEPDEFILDIKIMAMDRPLINSCEI